MFERREPCKAMFVSKCTHFAFSCSRAILADVFRGISKDGVPMVTGNLLHQVIQRVLVKWAESHDNGDDIRRNVTREDVEEMIGSVLSSRENLNQLYVTMEEYYTEGGSMGSTEPPFCVRAYPQ